MSISTSIILDTRYEKKSGKYPVKLRVISNRVPRDYQTIYDLSQADYKKLSAPRVSDEMQEIRKKFQGIITSADALIGQLEPFDFFDFEKEFIHGNKLFKPKKLRPTEVETEAADDFDYGPYLKRFTIFSEDHSKLGTISITFLSYIKKLLQQGRIGSAINYQRTYRSIKAFKGNVTFAQITVGFLYQYEKWMLERGDSKTTVGIVLRPLRSIFNEAIEEKIIRKDKCYPFGLRKYQIPASRNLKKALTAQELKSIFYYETNCERQRKGKAYWLFCYLANGMNVKDMIYLKWKNIQGEYLIFERAKSEKAKRADVKPIIVYLTEDLWDIIKTEGNPSRQPNDYIFPIITPELNPLELFDLLNGVRKLINSVMTAISKDLGINKKVTTIVTRHSFSTQMKRSGASTEYIQEALGHANKKTIENYLDSFENDVKKEFANKLLSFKQSTQAADDFIS
ncbi:MAG: site-specific integrase [Chitinophagaceae bacterium]|nr:site-specific integrase [Chitinophagaceae bacterium]